MVDRFTNSALWSPSSAYSQARNFWVHAKCVSPLSGCLRDVVDGDEHAVRAISVLRRTVSPSTVLGRVGAVVVDAVQGVFVWAASHVGKERRKTLAPPVAHADAPAAVSGIGLIGRPRASVFGALPCHPFSASTFSASSVAVCQLAFAPVASTTPRSSSSQGADLDSSFCAAFASANPPRGVAAMRSRNGRPASELLAGNVDVFAFFGHELMIARSVTSRALNGKHE